MYTVYIMYMDMDVHCVCYVQVIVVKPDLMKE